MSLIFFYFLKNYGNTCSALATMMSVLTLTEGDSMENHPFVVEIEVVSEKNHHSWWLDGAGRLKTYDANPESRETDRLIAKTLAEKLGINHSKVTLVQGEEKRVKRFKIGGNTTLEQLIAALDAKKIV